VVVGKESGLTKIDTSQSNKKYAWPWSSDVTYEDSITMVATMMDTVHKKRQERGDEAVTEEPQEETVASSQAPAAEEGVANEEVEQTATDSDAPPVDDTVEAQEQPADPEQDEAREEAEAPVAALTDLADEPYSDDDSDDSSMVSDEDAEHGAPWMKDPTLTEAP